MAIILSSKYSGLGMDKAHHGMMSIKEELKLSSSSMIMSLEIQDSQPREANLLLRRVYSSRCMHILGVVGAQFTYIGERFSLRAEGNSGITRNPRTVLLRSTR